MIARTFSRRTAGSYMLEDHFGADRDLKALELAIDQMLCDTLSKHRVALNFELIPDVPLSSIWIHERCMGRLFGNKCPPAH
jgi:hypothetical protein